MAEEFVGSPDPVLVRLNEWAAARDLSREAVAQAIGVKRPTVAGWFLGLEADQRGDPRPRSARDFRYTNQRPEVQQRIAEVLDRPVDLLRAESVGRSAAPTGPVETGTGLLGSEMWEVARSLVGDLAVGGVGHPDVRSQRHRVAEVVENVDRVVATTVVAVPRGRCRTVPHQYQVAVLVAPPDADDARPLTNYLRSIRDTVDAALDNASLACLWEHGVQQPDVRVMTTGVELLTLGSLICASLSGSRRPRGGLLVEPRRAGLSGHDLRVAAIVSNPYGGSAPIGGLLAQVLGAGHLRDNEFIHAIRNAQAERRVGVGGQRGAFLSAEAARDSGFILHVVLHLLERGDLPGAWFLSMGASSLHYDPVRRALAAMRGVVVVVRLGPQWRRHAAWRLSTAARNEAAPLESLRDRTRPASSDWMQLTPGADIPAADLEILSEQAVAAEKWLIQLEHGEAALDALVRERRDDFGLPTFSITLDELPNDVVGTRFDEGRFRPVTGDDRFAGSVVFPDTVDGLMDSWTDAAIDVLDGFAALAGHESGESLVDVNADDHIALALRLRRDTKEDR
jgi:hypothetical protein